MIRTTMFDSNRILTRDERQAVSKDKYYDQLRTGIKGGTLVACTGFGKTRVATNVLKDFRSKYKTDIVQIIVPSNYLVEQWESIIKTLGYTNVNINTIHSISLKDIDTIHAGMLIIDEIHGCGAEQFSKVFDGRITWKILLGLTATLEREDGKEELIKEFAPVFDVITIKEAKKNKWVADHYQYNLLIPMTRQNREEYSKQDKNVNALFAYFGHDYNVSRNCMRFDFAKQYVIDNAIVELSDGKPLDQDKLARTYQGRANALAKCFQARKEIVYSSKEKMRATVELIEKLRLKTVTFAETKECPQFIAEELTKKGIPTAYYYSDMPAVTNTDLFGQEICTIKKSKLKDYFINGFINDRFEVLATAKALNEGMDIPGIQLGVIISRTSTERVQTQRIGRVIRHEEDKVAIIVNIVLAETVDGNWVEKCTKGMNVRTFTDIDLLVSDIKSRI